MQKGVTPRPTSRTTLRRPYDILPINTAWQSRAGFGRSNIASDTPLDAFQKLFLETQVVLAENEPRNDYFDRALQAA